MLLPRGEPVEPLLKWNVFKALGFIGAAFKFTERLLNENIAGEMLNLVPTFSAHSKFKVANLIFHNEKGKYNFFVRTFP